MTPTTKAANRSGVLTGVWRCSSVCFWGPPGRGTFLMWRTSQHASWVYRRAAAGRQAGGAPDLDSVCCSASSCVCMGDSVGCRPWLAPCWPGVAMTGSQCICPTLLAFTNVVLCGAHACTSPPSLPAPVRREKQEQMFKQVNESTLNRLTAGQNGGAGQEAAAKGRLISQVRVCVLVCCTTMHI